MATTTQEFREAPQQAGVLTVGELGRTIKRNGVVFWLTLIFGIIAGVVISLVMTPKYAAATEILVEGASENGVSSSIENVLGDLTVQNATYSLATQTEILQSQNMYFRALQAANIPIPQTVRQLEALPSVQIRQKKISNVFQIVAEGKSEKDVRAIAEVYPQVYRDYIFNIKSEAIGRGRTFLESRMDEEKQLLEAAETDFANFKEQQQVTDTNTELEARVSRKVSDEQRLATAEARADAAIANVAQLERELENLPENRESTVTRTNNDILLQNKERLTQLKIERQRYATIYKKDAPQVKEIDAQIAEQEKAIADLDANIATKVVETNPQKDQVRSALILAQGEKAAAIADRDKARELLADSQSRIVSLAALTKDQRDLERRIQLHTQTIANLTEFKDRYTLKDNELRSSTQQLTETVFSEQTRPNWVINMVVATMLSLALAVVFAITRDSLQDKVHSIEEAYALGGLDILTRIPERPRNRKQLINDPQTSAAFESYRVLRSIIGFMSDDDPIKSIVITSTAKGEGKTVVASNLAVAFALNGQKVVLVDANFRNPGIHTLFGKNEKPGLGDVLLGESKITDVILESEVPGLSILPSGTVPANSTEALGSARMEAITEELEGLADIVIFDSPATLGLADAPSLSTHADGTIMVLQNGKPGKSEYSDAVGVLRAASPRLLGTVFNRVKVKQARLDNA